MPKWLIEKLKKRKAEKKNRKIKKTIRRKLRKIFNKKNLTKLIILISGLALIASYTLPYILR